MGDDQAIAVELQLAPTGDRNSRLPGEGRCPTQSPIGADRVACALDVMQVKLRIAKPGFDELDHALIAIAPSKLVHRIFEIHIRRIDAVGLMIGKVAVIGL